MGAAKELASSLALLIILNNPFLAASDATSQVVVVVAVAVAVAVAVSVSQMTS